MKSKLERQPSDSSETSSRSNETPPKRKWAGRIQSKLSLALDSNNKTAAIEKLTARSDDSCSSSSDSALSCSSLESGEEEEEVEDWFANDSEEVGENIFSSPSNSSIEPEEMWTSESNVTSEYILDQKELYNQLRAISDLQFDTLDQKAQEELMRTVVKQDIPAGAVIIKEGDDDDGGCFYLILASPPGSEVEAQVEVVRNVGGSEEFLTTLGPSQYFGQKFFLSNRTIRRNATVRAVTRTILGAVYPKDFYLWHKFRTFLLMKAVPLIRTLPQSEQIEMYSLLQHQEFSDGEYIIRQGDVGDKFYIITDGAADVIEESFDGYHYRREILTRLYEGHFFGEMAIIYDEPRVASVVAVGRTSCLYLSKAAFREALSTQQFHMMMQNVAYERTIVRERREKTHIAKLLSHETSSSTMSTLTEDMPLQSPSIKSIGPGMPYRLRRVSDSAAFQARSPRVSDSELSETGTPNEVTTTNVLVRKRLATGDKFINKYLIIRELGRGSFGGVYLVRDEETDKLYAMKVISKSAHKWNMNVTNEIKREIAIMKNLRHPNIVSLLEVIDDPSAKQVYLIQEYLEGGPLMPGEGIVGEPLPTDKTWVYFRDMLRGVSYLHSQGVVHRDLKPQNMLLTADDVLKIADFGAAVLTGGGAKVLAAGGTPAFMAPELFQTGLSESENTVVNSPQVDVWGLGATLYNMVFGRPPWMAANQIQLAEMVQKIELTFPKDKEFNIDPHLRHLLKRMLDKDPRTRITMAELGWHEWVTKEGSQPLDDDFDLATYDARDVNEVLISQAIPEFIGAIPLRRLSGSVTNPTESDHIRLLTQTPPLRSGKSHSITSSRSDPSESHDHEFDDLDRDHHVHGKIIESPSNRSVSSIGSFGFQPSGTRTPPGTGVASGVSDTLQRSAALLALVHSEGDDEVPILSNPRPKSLKNTKHQEFVARPTEIKLGDSGEVWKGVIMTNPKNRNENDLGFTWNSQNLKPKRRFGRSSTISSDEANDSDHDDSSHGMPTKSKSMNLSRSSSESSRSHGKTMKSKSTSTMHSPAKDQGRSPLPTRSDNSVENTPEVNDVQSTAIKLLQNRDSMSLGSTETNTSDSEDEDVQLVMEMEPAGSNPGSRPRPLSLSSSKKLSDLCEYVSDDEIVSLDDDGLENMLDSLCAPSKDNKRDAQLQPLTFDLRTQDTLQVVKTWTGQSNLRTGIRYGIAEITNGRDSMEDRTTAKASIEEEAKRQKERALSGAIPTSSFHLDYLSKGRTEDFGFFGVYDGHEGCYVSEYLQNHLHLRFRQRLAINSMRGAGVKQSFLEAASLIDDEILRIDFERMKIAKEARVSMTSPGNDLVITPPKLHNSNPPLPPVPPQLTTSTSTTSNREKGTKQNCSPNSGNNPDRRKGSSSLMKDGGAQSFAGSTAVVAIVYGGWPYETPTQSIEASPRNSTASSSSRRSSGNTNKSHISFNSSSHSLIHHDSFIKHALSGGSDLEVVPEDLPNHPYQIEQRREETIDLTELRSSLDEHVESNPPKPEDPHVGPRPPVKIFIAHVGDCRAVLSESGVAVQLTMDHSPKSVVEQERIEAAGGWVHNGRVNGVLGVSRSFGDIMYKNYLPEEKSSSPLYEGDIANVWQPHYQVISLPETLELVVQPTHEFLVLASDGLWEKCSCVEVVNFVRRRLFEHGDVMRAAKEMVAKVESQGGSDNTSIIIICLNQLSKTASPSKGPPHPLRRMSASQSSSSLSAGSLSPNTSFTEENLRGLRRGTGSWRRAQSLARVNISPSCSFRVMNLSPSIQTRDRDDSG